MISIRTLHVYRRWKTALLSGKRSIDATRASDELKLRDDALIFQSLREDFKVCESYEGTDRALPEEIPIVAIGIRGDCRYDESMINSWRDHGRNVRVEWFDSPDATHQHRVLLSRPEEFGAWLTREIFRAD